MGDSVLSLVLRGVDGQVLVHELPHAVIERRACAQHPTVERVANGVSPRCLSKPGGECGRKCTGEAAHPNVVDLLEHWSS